MKKSIKKRLTINFIFIVFISILIFEVILIEGVREYYYKNTEEVLTNQIKTSADFYNKYFSTTSLEENVLNNVDAFWNSVPAQVQIINSEGKILMDSIGVSYSENVQDTEFKKALIGEKGKWMGKVSYDNYGIMAISYPLKSNGEIVGVLRFITSLKNINKEIKKISMIFIAIGAIVIIIAGSLSFVLSNTIVGPLENVTRVAEKMADGELNIRSEKKIDDEIGKLSDTLNYMAEEIKRKESLKNDFISSVSHELRTPLTSIKGWALTLKDKKIQDWTILEQGLTIIEKESERLSTMVEELLDFSKFVSGRITLNKEDMSIEKLIKFIQNHMTPIFNNNNINFNVHIQENIPLIKIDKNRMKQVLINILDNAMKFTDENGIIMLNVYSNKEYLIMEVIDNGCGISEEDLPNVKEKFYKGKNSKSKNGIGLSICDEIVKLHKGSMDIDSKLGEGTKVTIKIPMVLSEIASSEIIENQEENQTKLEVGDKIEQ